MCPSFLPSKMDDEKCIKYIPFKFFSIVEWNLSLIVFYINLMLDGLYQLMRTCLIKPKINIVNLPE